MSGWPWPLDGVQDWFEDLWNWISEAAQAAVSVVSTWINDAISGLWTTINTAFTGLWTSVSGALGSLWNSISGAVGGLWTSISTGLGNLWASVSRGLGNIWTRVSAAVSSLYNAYVEWAMGVWNSITAGLGDLWNSISGAVGGLWDNVSRGLGDLWAGFVEWGGNLVSNITTMFDGAVSAIGGWIGEALAGVASALGSGLQTFLTWLLEAVGFIADMIMRAATWVRDLVAGPITDFGRAIAYGLLEALMPGSPDEETETAVKKFAERYLDRMKELAPKKSSPLPELPALLASAAGVVSLNILTALGGEAVGLAIDQAHPLKNMGVRDISADLVNSFQMPAMVGPLLASPVWPGIIIPLRYRMNEMFPNMIPDAPDLIRFMVFEVIDRGVFEEYMGYHGFSGMIAGWFYEGHWVLLPLGEVKAARHRGIINDAELAKFLVLHDYRPEPRPGIRTSDRDIAAQLVWDLPGRIEARWMFRWGIKDRDGLKELLIKGGLDPEYADDAADAVAKNQFLREIRMQETNIKADLRDGYITEATARADLYEIGYPYEFIEYHVADALKDRERQHKKRLLDIYQDSYLKDLPTEPTFEKAVPEILVDPEAADLFIRETYIRKYKKPKAE